MRNPNADYQATELAGSLIVLCGVVVVWDRVYRRRIALVYFGTSCGIERALTEALSRRWRIWRGGKIDGLIHGNRSCSRCLLYQNFLRIVRYLAFFLRALQAIGRAFALCESLTVLGCSRLCRQINLFERRPKRSLIFWNLLFLFPVSCRGIWRRKNLQAFDLGHPLGRTLLVSLLRFGARSQCQSRGCTNTVVLHLPISTHSRGPQSVVET